MDTLIAFIVAAVVTVVFVRIYVKRLTKRDELARAAAEEPLPAARHHGEAAWSGQRGTILDAGQMPPVAATGFRLSPRPSTRLSTKVVADMVAAARPQ